MEVLKRNNVSVRGKGKQPMMFAHGYGCDQNMWRYVVPAFEDDYKIILFDHVGAGGSDLSAYDSKKYDRLDGYADDILDIVHELDLRDIIFVGHSVSAVIGLLATIKEPERFSHQVMVGPSPSYINDAGYVGGFTRQQIDELLEALDNNHLGWSVTMAPVIMGNPDRKELGEELANSFCRTDPAIAKHFARTTFLTDVRDELSKNKIPALVLQCAQDVIAPVNVGEYMQEQMPGTSLVFLDATGHCPNLSAPGEVISAIKNYLADAGNKS